MTIPLRIFAALSTSALVIGGLAACTSDDTATTAKSGDSGAMTIQFVNPLPSYPTWKQFGQCMKEQAETRGADLTESGPTGQAIDGNAMIQQVQQAIANKKDAVVTMPVSDGFAPLLQQAQKAGILTGTIYGPGGADSGADYNIGPDWTLIGQTVVGAVAALPGNHVLGLVAPANTGLGKSWMDGVKAAAAKTGNVKIVGEVYTGDDATKGLPQVTALLTAHPDITQIVTNMGTTTPGATAAIKAKNLKGKVFLTAVGHENGGTEAIKDGTANLMLLEDVCSEGKRIVDGIVDLHEKKTPQKVAVQVAVVGQDKVQGYLDKGWV
ncbi:sugar ABC transporter substrate-binding protein [Cryptosporangium sp. NPDC048952]|uniref:sugar ABC transporter substrate-binding protein n=1 Tax=Cryptosporangium sp. NPDC048952 TaxID=3363961 RepID=UPI00371C5A07